MYVYKNTLEKQFPLILIIGREPNEEGSSVDYANIWNYDFSLFPRCAFWNISHGLLAHSCGVTTAKLKSIFVANNCSPIVYSDASPIPLLNQNEQKRKIRSSIDELDFIKYTENIFSQKNIIDRVKIVILSGLEKKEFELSKSVLIKNCIKRGIEYFEVAFFYPTNKQKIILQSQDYLSKLQSIYNSYLQVNKKA